VTAEKQLFGWPHGAGGSDGEARERVSGALVVVAIEEFSGRRKVQEECFLTRGGKKAHWKARRESTGTR